MTLSDGYPDEYAALTSGCGLADLSWRGRLEILGADRLRFLNAYLTCDVKSLVAGEGAYGFFTSAQGRVLSDAVVLAHADRLWVEVAADREEEIAKHLRKYVLADRVEVRPLGDMLPLALIGPRAGELLGPDLPAAAWQHARRRVLGTEVTLQKRGLLGAPAHALWVSASIAPMLRAELRAAGAVEAGFDALEALRAEAGIPRCGQDFGPETFPQETGLDAAVSYTKGCYLGQEVVARIHYRGGVQRAMRRLVFSAGEPPRPGAALLYEGREAGTATTVVVSPASGRTIGLGLVHKRAAEPGTRLDVEGEGGATAEVAPSLSSTP